MTIRTFFVHLKHYPNQAFFTAVFSVLAAVWLSAPAIAKEEKREEKHEEELEDVVRDKRIQSLDFDPFSVEGQRRKQQQRDRQALLGPASEATEVREEVDKQVQDVLRAQGRGAQILRKATQHAYEHVAQIEKKQQQKFKELIQQQQQEIHVLHAKLQQLREGLKATNEEIEVERLTKLPPLENGKLVAFHLKYVDPRVLAGRLEVLLGANQLRLVPDPDQGTLIAYAKEDSMDQIHDLIMQLDTSAKRTESSTDGQLAEKPKSLTVRIFWLADGLPEGEGTESTEFLPTSVLKAVGRLGLRAPKLVSQSSASLALSDNDKKSNFHFSFPAIVHGEQLRFQSSGEMLLDGQPRLDLQVEISGPNPLELAGRLSAPLGHYMVLGTANYVTDRSGVRGRGGGYGRRGARGGEGGYGDEGGYGEAPVPKPKLSTSRFAFVVQVIEAESFAPNGE